MKVWQQFGALGGVLLADESGCPHPEPHQCDIAVVL